MAPQAFFQAVDQAVEQTYPTIKRLAHELWQLAELSLEEVQSARLLLETLRAEGFAITSKDTANVPTAFMAEWGTGSPILGMYDLLPNRPLAERMQSHLERIGVPDYTAEEQAFARELQSSFGAETKGMAAAPEGLPSDEPAFGFSTDVGDVSWCAPTMGCGMPTVPLGIGLHTWAASHGTSIGLKGAMYAASMLAATGLDILTDADLRQAARADFERRTEGKPYISPLGPEMERPLEIPDWVLAAVGD